MNIIKYLLSIWFFLITHSLYAQVNPAFQMSTDEGCAPLLVTFTDQTTGASSSATYSWTFGNSATSTLKNPSTTYSTAGTYVVTLVIRDNGITYTKTDTVTVNPLPSVSFTGTNITGCAPLTTSFTSSVIAGTSGSVTYKWLFGDGTGHNTANPSKTYNNAGRYSVSLEVTNGKGCVATSTRLNYVEVFAQPTATVSVSPTSICNIPSSFTATATTQSGKPPFTYNWTFNSNTGTGNTYTGNVTTAGAQTVQVIVTDSNNCKDTVLANVTPNSISAAFTAPTQSCVNTPIQLTNTSTSAQGIDSVVWTFGDGHTSRQTNPTHTYTSTGTYIISLTVFSRACSRTINATIIVNPEPTVTISANTLLPCPIPNATVTFSGPTNLSSYLWHFGDGTTSTNMNPTKNYTSNGWFEVTLEGYDANGCKVKSNTLNVNVSDFYIEPGPFGGCLPFTLDYLYALEYTNHVMGSRSTYPHALTSLTLDWGDGSANGNLTNRSHTYTQTGTYPLTISGTTANGCSFSFNSSVSVDSVPIIDFTATPRQACRSTPIQFTPIITGQYTNVEWNLGDDISFDYNPLHQYSKGGTIYDVELIVHNGKCRVNLIKQQYIEIYGPKLNVQTKLSCDTANLIHFNNLTTQYDSLYWLFGDGQQSTQLSPSHQYANDSPRTAMLIGFNYTHQCIDTLHIQIYPGKIPIDQFGSMHACWGDVVTLKIPPQHFDSLSRYTWYQGTDSVYGIIDSFEIAIDSLMDYPYKLKIVNVDGCPFEYLDTIFVTKPIANFTVTPSSVCDSGTLTFTAGTQNRVPGIPNVKYDWDFDDNTTAGTNNNTTTHFYGTPQKYSPTLIVTDSVGCKDTITKTDDVDIRKFKPEIDVSAKDGCTSSSLVFSVNNVDKIASYQWTASNGRTSASSQFITQFTTPGYQWVKVVIVDSFGCTDSIRVDSIVNIHNPIADFTLSDTVSICPPLVIQLTNTSIDYFTSNWNFGNGSTSNVDHPITAYYNTGQFNITLVVRDMYGCADTVTKSVRVLGYSGMFNYSPLKGCAPLEVNFKSQIGNIPVFIWDFADGTTVVGHADSYKHNYLTPGKYVPKIIIGDGNQCQQSVEGLDTIYVDELKAAMAMQPDPVCFGDEVKLYNQSSSLYSNITSRLWHLPGGTNSTIDTNYLTFNDTGYYKVTLIVKNGNNCTDTLVDSIYVRPLPIINALTDTTICVGDTIIVSGQGGQQYTWSPSTYVDCNNCASTKLSVTTPTDFILTGTDAFGCSNKDTLHIKTQTATTFDVFKDTSVCAGEEVPIYAFGAQQYQWSPTALIKEIRNDSVHVSMDLAGQYTITVVGKEGSCAATTKTVQVKVNPVPQIGITGPTVIVGGQTADLIVTGTNANKYIWDEDPTLNCIECSKNVASPFETKTYYVTGYNQFNCSTRADITIQVKCSEQQVFIPNAITPNNDGKNDVFYPRGGGISEIKMLRIYNRWGQLVYEARNFNINDISKGWDGTMNGKPLDPDVFVYYMEGVCNNGESLLWKGDVSILK